MGRLHCGGGVTATRSTSFPREEPNPVSSHPALLARRIALFGEEGFASLFPGGPALRVLGLGGSQEQAEQLPPDYGTPSPPDRTTRPAGSNDGRGPSVRPWRTGAYSPGSTSPPPSVPERPGHWPVPSEPKPPRAGYPPPNGRASRPAAPTTAGVRYSTSSPSETPLGSSTTHRGSHRISFDRIAAQHHRLRIRQVPRSLAPPSRGGNSGLS
jgi:hypothetical protein